MSSPRRRGSSGRSDQQSSHHHRANHPKDPRGEQGRSQRSLDPRLRGDDKRDIKVTLSRQVARDVIVRVLRDEAYLDRTLDAMLKRVDLPARDRALVTELTYGTLRRQIFIDDVIARYAKAPLDTMPVEAVVSLRLGVYQLLFTRIAPHSAVDESVQLVRQTHPRMTGFTNAVLRRIIREQAAIMPAASVQPAGHSADIRPIQKSVSPSVIRSMAVALSFPEWIMAEVIAQRGLEGARAWGEATNIAPPLSLRVLGSDPHVRAQLADELTCAGYQVELPAAHPRHLWLRGAGQADNLPGFATGVFAVQDPASSMVGTFADPTAGSTVLDLCAAPGGKAMQLAELVGASGRVLALDVHPGKARLITENAQRLQLPNVIVDVADGTDQTAVQRCVRTHTGKDMVDMVLIDAPCAGLGTLRRHPELRVRRRDRDQLANIAQLQERLLENGAQFVRPGGILVYSVCSLTRAEGPERIAAFLAHHPEFHMAHSPMQTWTDQHNGVDCFFAARLERSDRQAATNLQP